MGPQVVVPMHVKLAYKCSNWYGVALREEVKTHESATHINAAPYQVLPAACQQNGMGRTKTAKVARCPKKHRVRSGAVKACKGT